MSRSGVQRRHAAPKSFGRLSGLASFATAILVIHLFSESCMHGLQQWIVEAPLQLLVLLTAHHIFFGPGSDRNDARRRGR